MSRRTWTASDVDELGRRYPDEPTRILAAHFGCSIQQVYSKAEHLGLKKSATYLASHHACRIRRDYETGADTRFQKGATPWNKGTYFTAGGRSAETRFKPGNRTGRANDVYQPIGTERISKDGYRERKTNDDLPFYRRWRGVHIIEWEAVNGPLPAGHALVFRDGNKQHVALDNLELVTRGELMRRNSIHRYGKEIAQLHILRGAITRHINRRSKNV